jgi:hypothetical protein
MKNKKKVKAIACAIVIMGAFVGGCLVTNKKNSIPLPIPTKSEIVNTDSNPNINIIKNVSDGLEILGNDEGLLGYTMDKIYDASKKLTPNEQLTNQILYSNEKATSQIEIIPWCKQFEAQTEEWSRNLNEEKKGKMRFLINLVRDIRDGNIEFRGISFNNLPFSIQEDIKSILDDMIFIYNNGYPKDRENLQEYENALRSVVDNKVIGLRQ